MALGKSVWLETNILYLNKPNQAPFPPVVQISVFQMNTRWSNWLAQRGPSCMTTTSLKTPDEHSAWGGFRTLRQAKGTGIPTSFHTRNTGAFTQQADWPVVFKLFSLLLDYVWVIRIGLHLPPETTRKLDTLLSGRGLWSNCFQTLGHR